MRRPQALCCVNASASGDQASFYYPLDELVSSLFEEAGRRLQYKPEELQLTCNIGTRLVILNDHKSETLKQTGLIENETHHIALSLLTEIRPSKRRCAKLKMGALTAAPTSLDEDQATNHNSSAIPLQNVPSDQLTNHDEATSTLANDVASALPMTVTNQDYSPVSNPTVAGDLAPPPEPPPPPPVILQRNRFPAVTYHNEVPSSSAIPFVGLVNQAMTCYLNSLLQALFMTPEFRNAMYHWEFEGSPADETTSIPYQLQKLFLNLQTSSRAAVETTALTKSFGWQSSDAWQQHDIQELCRVMFDALERKFQKTDQADLINRLYEGTMIDYVKCLECSMEKQREDKFLDIPLPVRPFGSTVAYGSVEEALRAFVQHETLDENNQYHCEKCQKKCDAHKGLKFTKFPYLLTLHLKRFDFDYATLNRIKLNDRVSFPDYLNLNGLIVSKSGGDTPIETAEEAVKCDDSSTTDSGSALDEDNTVDTPTIASQTYYQDDDEGIDISNAQEAEKNGLNSGDSNIPGPYKYELFSIMIHSGSASGGHYYAYIKDFSQGEWYCFNDQSVSRITYDDIRKTYGGGRGYYSGAYSLSTNAYMLMYRQIDKTRNATAMTSEEFTPHLHKLLKKIEEQKELDMKNREREEKQARYKLLVQAPNEPMKELRFVTSRDVTLKDATREAYEYANLEGVVPFEQCRLVTYDKGKKCIESSFEGGDDETLESLLRKTDKEDLHIEIRGKDEQFQIYRPKDTITRVVVINAERGEIKEQTNVRTNLNASVLEFKQVVANALQTTPDRVTLLLETYGDIKLMDKNTELVQHYGFFSNCRVYAVDGENVDLKHIQNIARASKNVITLFVTLPTVTKEARDELNIPPTEDVLSCHRQEETNGDQDWEREFERDRMRDASPQPLHDPEDALAGPHSDQSASEDSSVTDGERTIVGDAPEHSPGVSPVAWEQNTSSPENEKEEVNSRVLNWTNETRRVGAENSHNKDYCYGYDNPPVTHPFRAIPCNTASTSMLRAIVDKRITLKKLKECLEPHVGVPADYFKVFRVNNGKDTEYVRADETFTMLGEEDCLEVRLGRALRTGEHAGKVYLLDLLNIEEERFLIEWVIAENAQVCAVKREILNEVRRKCGLDIPLELCRLRRKKWTDPSKPYLDDSCFTDIGANWDLYLQKLDGPEPLTNEDQPLLLVRQWSPSTLQLRPAFELVLNTRKISELRDKIAQVSNIALENLELAVNKGKGADTSRLIRLPWHNTCEAEELSDYPFLMEGNDSIIIFRDKTEELKGLTEKEQRELNKPASAKPTRVAQRRERALKIYVDGSPPSSSSPPQRSTDWDDDAAN